MPPGGNLRPSLTDGDRASEWHILSKKLTCHIKRGQHEDSRKQNTRCEFRYRIYGGVRSDV